MENGNEATTILCFDSESYRIFADGTGGNGEVVTVNESGKVDLAVVLQVGGEYPECRLKTVIRRSRFRISPEPPPPLLLPLDGRSDPGNCWIQASISLAHRS